VAARLTEAVDGALKSDTDPDSYLRVKVALLAFILTLEVHACQVSTKHILTLIASPGISILDDVSTCVDLSPVREICDFA
jgi:hypothetical protein